MNPALVDRMTSRKRAGTLARVEIGELPSCVDSQDVVWRNVQANEHQAMEHVERRGDIGLYGVGDARRTVVGIVEELVKGDVAPLPDAREIPGIAERSSGSRSLAHREAAGSSGHLRLREERQCRPPAELSRARPPNSHPSRTRAASRASPRRLPPTSSIAARTRACPQQGDTAMRARCDHLGSQQSRPDRFPWPLNVPRLPADLAHARPARRLIEPIVLEHRHRVPAGEKPGGHSYTRSG
jgi:hypothetical protein